MHPNQSDLVTESTPNSPDGAAKRAADPTTDSQKHFDLCVIGSGSGLGVMPPEVTAHWRVALIDAGIGPGELFGGTCLNAGCIPSKMFSVPATISRTPSWSGEVDVKLGSGSIDFAALQRRTFGRTDAISTSGLEWQLTRDNVEVFRSTASFVDEHTLRVGHELITADRFVIAAGSRPRPLDVAGLDEAWLQAYLHTSESIMRIPQPPHRLVILGGGTEAVEFAHIFDALGSQVTIVNRSSTLLRKMDDDVAKLITAELGERMSVRVNQQLTAIEPGTHGGVVVTTEDADGIEYSYEADLVLSVIGRVPNSDLLNVAAAGVATDAAGFIKHDQCQRTSQPHIFAIGDICNHQMIKHLANAQSRTVLAQLLAELNGTEPSIDDPGQVLPVGIFTSPEIASFGLTEQQVIQSGVDHVCHTQKYDSTAYGWALNDDKHFVKLIACLDGRLLGAHIVGPQATTLLQPLVMYQRFDLDVRAATRQQFWIHPALTEVVENALLGLAEKIASVEESK